MRFIADEGVDAAIVLGLRAAGHQVLYVAELDPGIDDERVLAFAVDRGAVLITADKDFGELVFRLHRATSGVLLIRLGGLPAEEKARLVVAAVAGHAQELTAAFGVLRPGSLRIRPEV